MFSIQSFATYSLPLPTPSLCLTHKAISIPVYPNPLPVIRTILYLKNQSPYLDIRVSQRPSHHLTRRPQSLSNTHPARRTNHLGRRQQSLSLTRRLINKRMRIPTSYLLPHREGGELPLYSYRKVRRTCEGYCPLQEEQRLKRLRRSAAEEVAVS